MSRSYRATYITDGYKGSKSKQFFKQYANCRVRKANDVPNGKAYRKYFESWTIRDYRWYFSVNDAFYKKCPWRYIRK